MEEIKGLTLTEVEERKNKGLINVGDISRTKTIKEIFLGNIDFRIIEKPPTFIEGGDFPNLKNSVCRITNSPCIKEIFLGNIFTYFNILNIVLAIAIIVSGIIFNRFFYSLKNCLFLGVIICNTTISIVQEVMSKKTIDKLSILSSVKPKVISDLTSD